MLKNKDERRKWIDNYEENYEITVDSESIRVLESNQLPDGSRIVIIQIYTIRGGYDYDQNKYISSEDWYIIDRYIQLKGERTIHRRSANDLVEHLKGIKS